MSDSEREKAADALDREGEEPAAESGAGYGSHAPDLEGEPADESKDAR